MRIAVVGDVHGHLALLYAILGRWQRESGQRLDLILQVGDLGCFPHPGLDQATKRHAERDSEELGFAEFAGEKPPATLLDPRPPLVFIPGNHEDFEYLTACEAAADPVSAVYSVSRDERIMGLRSGRIWSFAPDAASAPVRIGGVSGVAHRTHKKHLHPRLHLREEEALALAEQGRSSFDILISHERAAGITGGFRHDLGGSEALQLVIDAVQPRLAFFGHYDRAGEWQLGDTRVFGLEGCGYERWDAWRVKRDGIALVEWSGKDVTVERLCPDCRTSASSTSIARAPSSASTKTGTSARRPSPPGSPWCRSRLVTARSSSLAARSGGIR
jgi:hypothetical protein